MTKLPTRTIRQQDDKLALALPLPEGVTVSPTALYCPQDLPIADWKSLGGTLSQIEDSIQWWLGDWWAFGSHRYGERKAMTTAKDALGRKFKTLVNYGVVARSIETPRRRGVLSWSLHCEVAKLKVEKQEHYLDRAVNENLSVANLRDVMRSDNNAYFQQFKIGSADDQRMLHQLCEAAKLLASVLREPHWKRASFEAYIKRMLEHNRYSAQDIADFFKDVDQVAACLPEIQQLRHSPSRVATGSEGRDQLAEVA